MEKLVQKFTCIIFFVLLSSGSIWAQEKQKVKHYIKIKAQSFPKNDWLIYELKDSTIVFVDYNHIGLFHKKTKEELMELEIKREFGELDLVMQEVSINYIDKISVRNRKGAGYRAIAGLFVGMITGVLVANAHCKPIIEQPEFDSWCHQSIPIFLGTTGIVTGVFAALPIAKLSIPINRNKGTSKHAYRRKFKEELKPFAILK